MQRLWAYYGGYVVVKLKGPSIERLLHRITQEGIGLWDVERLTPDTIVASLSVDDFRRLRPLLWQLSIKVSVVGRHGLPFGIRRVQRRPVLVAGLLLVLCLGYYLSNFIWFIQVTGTESVDKAQILAIALGEGVQRGVPKHELDSKDLETRLVLEIPELSWAGVTRQGVLIRIDVVERSMPDRSMPLGGDLLAGRDGLVTQVLVFKGTPKVAAGDTVRQGELLISGEFYGMDGKRQHGRAEGIVKARVWYEAVGEAALSKITQETTGRQEPGLTIELGARRLSWTQPSFDLYRDERVTWQAQVAGVHLPLAITKHDYREIVYESVGVPREVARKLAMERAWQALADQGVVRERVAVSQVEEYELLDQYGVRIGLVVELEENIAAFQAASRQGQ